MQLLQQAVKLSNQVSELLPWAEQIEQMVDTATEHS